MPTCAYEIGPFTVAKDGMLTWAENTKFRTINFVVTGLAEAGFTAKEMKAQGEKLPKEAKTADKPKERRTAKDEQTKPSGADATAGPQASPSALVVEIPADSLTGKARENLDRLIAGKSGLIQKALSAESLAIEEADGRLLFLWFTLTGESGETAAYTQFVEKLADQARTAKRVTCREKAVDNEKYAFRCFLLRLGFIGDRYKTARRILLKNLSGNSA